MERSVAVAHVFPSDRLVALRPEARRLDTPPTHDGGTAEAENCSGLFAAAGSDRGVEAAARGDDFLEGDSAGSSKPAETSEMASGGGRSLRAAENVAQSTLSAYPVQYDLADQAGVTVSWDIREDTIASDWIGLYRKEDTDPSKWIDFRNRGVNGARKGQIVWKLDNIESHFTSAETQVCFKYYSGKTGSLRASTQTITVRRNVPLTGLTFPIINADDQARHEGSLPAAEFVHFVIKDISAVHLRKGMFFNPDPYIKLWLQPATSPTIAGAAVSYRGHQQHTSVCENTTQPSWSQQVFAFQGHLTDLLIMKLKDKFVSSRPTLNRFLGLVTVPVKTLVERGQSGLPMKFAVSGRSPNDNVSGYLYFSLQVLKGTTSESGPHSSLDSTEAGSSSTSRNTSLFDSDRVTAATQRSFGWMPLAGDLGDEQAASELGYHSDSSGDESSLASSSGAALAAMHEAGSAPAVANATSYDRVGPQSRCDDLAYSLPGASLSLSAEDLDENHDEVNRINSSASSVPNLSFPSDAQSSQVLPLVDIDLQQQQHSTATQFANANGREPDRDRGVPERVGHDSLVAAAADAKRVRHALLSGSLSLAAVHPGKLTPMLLRSSSPRPAGSVDGLPAGWEARVDVHGRTFYIDHLNRKTTWAYPGVASGGSGSSGTLVRRVPSLNSEQMRQMDQRYSIIRRLTAKERGSPGASLSAAGAALATTAAAAAEATGSAPPHSASAVASPVTQAGTSTAVKGSRATPEVAAAASNDRPSNLPLRLHVNGVDRHSPDESSRWPSPHEQAGAAAVIEAAVPNDQPDYLRVPVVDSRPVTPVDDELAGDAAEHVPSRSAAAADSAASAAAASGSSRSRSRAGDSAGQQQAAGSSATSTTAVPTAAGEQPPAVRLLLRSDFFSLVQYDDECQKEFLRNEALKHMVHKIRRSPETFTKYMHNRDLVAFLNKFAQRDRELPSGWEMKLDKHRKPFFVDHTSRSTSYIDPRLPTDPPAVALPVPIPLPHGRHRKSASMDETRPSSSGSSPKSQLIVEPQNGDHASPVNNVAPVTTTVASLSSGEAASARESRRSSAASSGNPDLVPLAYDAKVVAFLRQDGIMDILQERSPSLYKNESLKRHVAAVIAEGTAALQRYRNNVDLTMLLSLFDQEIMAFIPLSLLVRSDDSPDVSGTSAAHAPGMHHHAATMKSDFQDKYRSFHQKLHSKGYGTGPGKIKLRLRRDHLLQDTYNRIMTCSKRELQKNKLLISFEGEAGLDYGGPAREFFFLFSREIFNPYYGLFEYSANDMYTVQISPVSQFVDLSSEWFRFAGRMLGLCILHQYLMDCYFTRPFYKMLLKQPCDLTDLESLDAEFHQSLLWIRDNDITDAGLDLTFSVDEEVFGQVAEHELKPGGRSLAVTERNKKEYIDRMVTWRVERGIAEQKESLLRGFHEVIDPKLVAIFDAKELELVIAGTAEIDVTDWRANTEYRSGYYDGHPVIVNYWRCIEKFDNEQRLRLLQFVTGTSSIPFEGFVALRGSNGPRKFTIERWGDPESLPRAHTCFNRLDLPPYPSLETMMDKLRVAIEETGTFGVE